MNEPQVKAVASDALLADPGSPCSLYANNPLVLERKRKGEEVWVPFGHYKEIEIEAAKATMRRAMDDYMAFGWRGEHRLIRVRFEIVASDSAANTRMNGIGKD